MARKYQVLEQKVMELDTVMRALVVNTSAEVTEQLGIQMTQLRKDLNDSVASNRMQVETLQQLWNTVAALSTTEASAMQDQTLSMTLENLEDKVELLQNSLDESGVADLQNDLAALRKDTEESATREQALAEKIETLQTKVAELKTEADAKAMQLQAIERETQRIQGEHAKTAAQLENLEKEKAKIVNSTGARRSTEEDDAELARRLQELADAELAKQLGEAAQNEEVEKLQEDFEKYKAASTEKIENLEKKLTEKNENNDKEKAELEKSTNAQPPTKLEKLKEDFEKYKAATAENIENLEKKLADPEKPARYPSREPAHRRQLYAEKHGVTTDEQKKKICARLTTEIKEKDLEKAQLAQQMVEGAPERRVVVKREREEQKEIDANERERKRGLKMIELGKKKVEEASAKSGSSDPPSSGSSTH